MNLGFKTQFILEFARVPGKKGDAHGNLRRVVLAGAEDSGAQVSGSGSGLFSFSGNRFLYGFAMRLPEVEAWLR